MQRVLYLLLIGFAAACSGDGNSIPQVADAPRTDPASAKSWTRGGMAVTANPHATAAAVEMLERGGHAIDAAIAAHAVLGLVEPQSSGIGGSAFILTFEHDSKDLIFYDGREMAPASATADLFLQNDEPMGFRDTWQSGIAIGVPGTVAVYELAHEAHGKLPWADLFEPAIRLSTEGFAVSPRMHNSLSQYLQYISLDHAPAAAAYLYPDGKALPEGFNLKNPEYAETLQAIAAGGATAFYSGAIAEAIVERVRQAPLPGEITSADIEGYEARARGAVCGAFREDRVCATAPPTSGVAHVMIPALYGEMLADPQADLMERVRVFVDAQRLAYADRDEFVADPDFVDVPVNELLDPVYLQQRATERFLPAAEPAPGDPRSVVHGQKAAGTIGGDASIESPGTSHLSIIDTYGNAVSMTASVGAPFGSYRLTGGFLLNNQMGDFARSPVVEGREVANVIVPGKRPRSSMSPTMVFDRDNDLRMITGSPGGNSIVAYTTKSIIAVLDWGFTAQQATDFPNVIARGATVRVEKGMEPGQQISDYLTAEGYTLQEGRGENSGIHLIIVHEDRLEGAADSRREGVVTAVPKASRQ